MNRHGDCRLPIPLATATEGILIMAQTNGTIKEAALDYLTLTFKPGWNREAARARAVAVQKTEDEDGEPSAPFRLHGYVGVAHGRVAWGDRHDGSILQLAGATAELEASVFLPLASHVSRVDMAVTVHLPDKSLDPAKEGYASGLAFQPTHGKPPIYDYRERSDGGKQLSIGSRTSPRYGRVYAKFEQCKLPFYVDCFRYECELKGALAPRSAARAVGSPDRGGFVAAYVHKYFSERAVPCYFDTPDPDVRLDSYRPRTSDLSRALWLARACKPVIDKLIARGRMADVVAALGLDYSAYKEQGLPAELEDWLRPHTKDRVNPVDNDLVT